ncbi:autotransporter outer membrane beta-barrel domain-containing protein [Enterobacter roggenkampii]|uniref:autotransporter outer membrane beta-barrel domain-containing protein n=1 Tax=Enterobacter roggenkampii TaxID=1812935 RepID=UPI003BBAA96A
MNIKTYLMDEVGKINFRMSISSAILIAGVNIAYAEVIYVRTSALITDNQSNNTYMVDSNGHLSVMGSSGVIGNDPNKLAIGIGVHGSNSVEITGGATINGSVSTNNSTIGTPGRTLKIYNSTVNGGVKLDWSASGELNKLVLDGSIINSKGITQSITNGFLEKLYAVHAINTGVNIVNSVITNNNGGGVNLQQFQSVTGNYIKNSYVNATDGTGILSVHDNLLIESSDIKVSKNNSHRVEGVRIASPAPDSLGISSLHLKNSKVESDGAGVYIDTGNISVSSSSIIANQLYGIGSTGGNIKLTEKTGVKSSNDATGITLFKNEVKPHSIKLDNSYVIAEQREALSIEPGATVRVDLYNGALLTSLGQTAVSVGGESDLQLYADNSHIRGDVIAGGDSNVNITMDALSTFRGSAININSVAINSGSIWQLINNSNVGFLSNKGLIEFSSVRRSLNNDGFKTLTVRNDYKGDGGRLVMNAHLGDDTSLADKLIINGDTSGTTFVNIINSGGAGGVTHSGLELIQVQGNSFGEFKQDGRIVAGMYDYYLGRGNATNGTNSNNWYLTSQSQDNSGHNDSGDNSGNGGNNGSQHTRRPEPGGYAANLMAASTLFNTRLNDRQGSGVYTDPVTGEQYRSSLWGRTGGGHTHGRLSDNQSDYTANRVIFQLGGDVLVGSIMGKDEWHFGVMGGYGKQDSSTLNSRSGYGAKGSVWGYSAGIYGTWYQNAKDRTGLYTDSWLLWNWFNNSVKGDGLAYEKYKSKGLTASLESGYRFQVGAYGTSGGMENIVYVTPQAQVLWSDVKADDHTEANGTNVQGFGSDNTQTRLGVRLSMTGQSRVDKGTVRMFEPFAEVNWLYKSKLYGVRMSNEQTHLQGRRNVVELKTGVEGRVSDNLSTWGNVSHQLGDGGYRDTQGMLGVKYVF